MDSSGNYVGTSAQAEWEALGCTGSIPIEADSGEEGTDFKHWDDVCLRNELMTGFLSSGSSNPLSKISVGGLEDLGYVVNYDNAEPVTVNPDCCFGGNNRRLGFFDNFFDRIQDFLEQAGPDQPRYQPELSPTLLGKARKEARRVLKNLRETLQDTEDIIAVGGEAVAVFMFDDEGNIRHQSFGWEDVQEEEDISL